MICLGVRLTRVDLLWILVIINLTRFGITKETQLLYVSENVTQEVDLNGKSPPWMGWVPGWIKREIYIARFIPFCNLDSLASIKWIALHVPNVSHPFEDELYLFSKTMSQNKYFLSWFIRYFVKAMRKLITLCYVLFILLWAQMFHRTTSLLQDNHEGNFKSGGKIICYIF